MTRHATKREAPATALPDLQHQFDVLTDLHHDPAQIPLDPEPTSLF